MSTLFARAVFAFLALPGVVAFLVPLLFIAPGDRSWLSNRWGVVPLVVGTTLLLACVREFYVAGRGTLAPWSPPTALVVTGMYRRSRNPMYVGVVVILLGWAIGYRSWPLALYAVAVLVAFHLRVVFNEEPWAARTFGDDWVRYRSRVPRWL
jgi:protein-S-isoprenylcysteine O-methyltransferase Ste14